MKKGITTTVSFIAVLFLSCTTDVSDCICTTEFVSYSIIVIDSSGDPVDSLTTRITNSSGREFDSHGSYFPNGPRGRYWIMDDSYKSEFTNLPTTIFFDGTKEDVTAEAAFLFNTGECKCHVNKVAGPDTVVVQ
jgi:hypothetical protein